MVELVVRLVFSLAVVLGMLMLLTKFSAKRFRGGTDALVRVVHRQPLSRTAAVAVVTVGSRVLVVGTTEHQVQLLTELDPEEFDLTLAAAERPALASVPSGPSELSDHSSLSGLRTARREREEYTSLDELLQPAADLETVQVGYAPRHAAPADAVPAASGAPVGLAAARDPRPSFSRAAAAARTSDSALAGSLLSAQTWKQAFAVATGRARDAS